MQDINITIHDEQLTLMPERALYWQRTQTLFIADVHFGKADTFRASAIPLPSGNTADDLKRLSVALGRTGAQKLIILGDLIHARRGRDKKMFDQVSAWRAAHPDLKIILVRGNHDRHAGDPPLEWGITCVDGPTPGPTFVLQHEPNPPQNPAAFALAGHLHPGVLLEGRGRQSLKLACFWFRERIGVLPAFGSFTGCATITPQAGERVYAVTERAVIPM